MKKCCAIFISFLLSFIAYAEDDFDYLNDSPFPQVELVTNFGVIVVELDRPKAPLTVANFLNYVVTGQYDNTMFHRIIAGFVVQGGGMDVNFQERPIKGTIANESGNGLSNKAYTIAMARDNDPHSATRQFYFNVADNQGLDPSPKRWGYAVFGEVVEGQEVLLKMSQVATGIDSRTKWDDVPMQPVTLIKATLLKI
ncbi:peptidylprolyl isomerase [Paraferrimonas sp. SM1919]|uniref:peptidylprolyl isomerase n=1 Tax=Paraferrimonas sp. SM1919 TaxID=2662263 RepID=UPI0013D4AFD3|nr:peptidylprolyl isomerase [Paraferrimonas sp. SM1919]